MKNAGLKHDPSSEIDFVVVRLLGGFCFFVLFACDIICN